MSFTSAAFYGFFAVVCAAYYLVPALAQGARRAAWACPAQNAVLLAACVWFAAAAGAATLCTAVGAALVCWAFGRWIDSADGRARRALTALGIALLVGLLAAVKYSGMLLQTAAALWPAAVRLPALSQLIRVLGVSYYTLTAIAYLVEVGRRRQTALRSPLRLALVLLFFPAFLSGPIGRVAELSPQLDAPRRFSYDGFASGMTQLLLGAFKKLVLADSLALVVDPAFAAPQQFSGPVLALAAVAFSLQLYYDFSGYTDMARGAAAVLGISLRLNFRRPFAARSFSELWGRWHMSLSQWFRDYVYIPLGGSRRGTARMCLATLAVFALSGLWHEAGWLFLVWGVLNGLFVLEEKLTRTPRAALAARLPGYAGSAVQRLWQAVRVLAIFSLCFIVFRVGENSGAGLADCAHYYSGLLRDWGVLLSPSRMVSQLKLLSIGRKLLAYLGGSLLLNETLEFLAARRGLPTADWVRSLPGGARMLLYYVLCLLVLFFGQLGTSSFIYFQF